MILNENAPNTVGAVAEAGMKQGSHEDNIFSAQIGLIKHIVSSNTLTDFEHLRITDSTEIPDQVPIIKIAGETIATNGDLIVFSGGVKTGKSSILDPIIAAALTIDGKIKDPIDDIEVTPNTHGYVSVHIDTEQSRPKHKQKVRAIKRRLYVESDIDKLLSYNVKQLNLEEYRPTTTSIIKAAENKYGKVYMIIIDGIADYISDPNNTEESNSIIKYVEQLAIEYDCPVLVIIHTNPGGDKERGNMGSQAIRKAASVLSLKNEGDISSLEPKYLRNAGRGKVPTILFKYDPEKGYHVSCGTKTESGSNKPGVKDKLQSAVDKIFAPPKALGYSQIVEQLMNHFNCSHRTAVTRWKELQTFSLVEQGPDKNWRKAV
jgi:hypothetical protein